MNLETDQDDEYLSLIVLFNKNTDIDIHKLKKTLVSLSPELADIDLSIIKSPENNREMIIILWQNHVAIISFLPHPLHDETIEACITQGDYSSELKDEAKQNLSFALLHYVGYHTNPLEQYTLLTLLAMALFEQGGVVVVNKAAGISMAIYDHNELKQTNIFEYLRKDPLTRLYSSVVKIKPSGEVWYAARTYGCDTMGLPDLICYFSNVEQYEEICAVFHSLILFQCNSGKLIQEEDMMLVAENLYMHARQPTEQDFFIESRGKLIVVELLALH